MWYYPIDDLVRIINIRNSIMSIQGWDKSAAMLRIVSHCEDFIDGAKVDKEKADAFTIETMELKMKTAYKWLKDEGAELE